MNQVQKKYEKIEDMKGIVVTTTELGGKKYVIEQKFWYKKPDKWKMESRTQQSSSTEVLR